MTCGHAAVLQEIIKTSAVLALIFNISMNQVVPVDLNGTWTE